MSSVATPTAEGPALQGLDERDAEPRTPMKRLGSTRKLAAFSNIKLQLAEQTRVLEARAEAAAGVAGELSDYCRRRADLEHEYARALDKLAKAAHQKHKDQRHKREQWTLTGAYSCWQAALENTKSLSRDHAALADLYGGPLAARLQRAADDALRLHRKCRDIVYERHEEIGAALGEAAAAGKAHAAAASEWRAAALKLRHAHTQRAKAAETPRQKKLKAIDKELEKRRTRHSEARAKALRARADYVLSLEAANATLQRYYLHDIADIMLCMEVGFEAVVGRTVRTAGAGEAACGGAGARAAGALLAAADALDSLHDRQRFVCAHAQAFAPPRPLPYRPPPPESQDLEMRELLDGAAEEEDEGTASVVAELQQRLQQLEAGARQLRAECRENAKTLDAAEAELVRQMEGSEIDVSSLFGGASTPAALPAATEDDASKKDQEDYYLAKFRSYVSCAGRLARLESKAAVVRSRILGTGPDSGRTSPPTPARRAALRRGLFAAPLDDTLPAVLRSCVRVIASYGVRHQGIFRVSGSQVEMQALRAAFERGEDPLARVRDASDINSVCGLLKLYLRELRPPLVPAAVSEQLLRVAGSQDGDIVKRLRQVMATLPTANMIVLRYLTAFLAHLTEYSEQNMMDAWNLAICLGPTLMAARGEGGAQVTAQNLVNELVKRIIIHHAEVFPQDVAPHTLYVKYPEAEPNAEADVIDEADGEVAEEADEPDAHEDDIRDDLSLYADDDDVVDEAKADVIDEADGEPADEPDEPDAHEDDIRDDQSLYADDDDEISEDGESGEWRERDSALHHNRSTSADRSLPAPQVREPANASPVALASLQCRRLAETTPDLVLDLPARAEPITPAEAPLESTSAAVLTSAAALTSAPASASAPSSADATPVDTADTFVHNRDTLKKRPAHKHSNSDASSDNRSEGEASNDIPPDTERTETNPGANGSPVPARNTARVAAKFADLTLTGGSLKPALAAKPALLRRPTPHPQHAKPNSAPAGGQVNPPSDSTC